MQYLTVLNLHLLLSLLHLHFLLLLLSFLRSLLHLLLFFLLLGLSTTIELSQLKQRCVTRPHALLIGMVGQFVFLPPVAYGVSPKPDLPCSTLHTSAPARPSNATACVRTGSLLASRTAPFRPLGHATLAAGANARAYTGGPPTCMVDGVVVPLIMELFLYMELGVGTVRLFLK